LIAYKGWEQSAARICDIDFRGSQHAAGQLDFHRAWAGFMDLEHIREALSLNNSRQYLGGNDWDFFPHTINLMWGVLGIFHHFAAPPNHFD
jgi:hypothetical protein